MTSWDDLKFLSALAEAGSLAQASRRLGVSHATVSRRITALERALGVSLVRRLARETPLTPIGREIAALTGQMGERHAAILRLARGAEDAVRGSIAISAPPVIASHLIAPHMGALRDRHPDLEINLAAEWQTASLSQGEADLAVRLMRPNSPGHIARRIGWFSYALYGAADWTCRCEAEWKFVTFDSRLAHVPQQRWLDDFIGGRTIVLRASDYATQLSAVRTGLGVALLPTVLGDEAVSVERVHDAAPAPREIWLVSHADVQRSAAMQAVRDYLVSILE